MGTITEGTRSLTISYGVDQQRRKSVFADSGTTTPTRYYFGNYEEELAADGLVRKIHYISGGNGLSAIYVQNGDADSLYYCYTDYQGNLLAVTNDTGGEIERLAYDPWGARRNPTNWSLPDTRDKHLFARGYTMHEHLEGFGLINMNGRAYDPMLARFLSPDPFIQAPGNWGNYNRYGYCMNNPLIYSDPTGEKWQWNWLDPMHWFSAGMQFINDNTTGLRQMMVDAGVPNFGVGVNSAGGTFHYVGNSGNIYHNQFDPGVNALSEISSERYSYSEDLSQADNWENQLDWAIKERFGVVAGDYGIDKFTLMPPSGYTVGGGMQFINKEGDPVLGHCRPIQEKRSYGKVYTGHSTVHISQKVFNYYLDGDYTLFDATVGHELIHAMQYNTIINPNQPFLDRAAYEYSYQVLFGAGRYWEAYAKMQIAQSRGFWGPRPQYYNVKNMGVLW